MCFATRFVTFYHNNDGQNNNHIMSKATETFKELFENKTTA